MTDEELIAWVRDISEGPSDYLQEIGNVAADRMEALVRELAVSNEIGRAFEEDAGQQRARAERLEAALRIIAGNNCITCSADAFNALFAERHLSAALKGAADERA